MWRLDGCLKVKGSFEADDISAWYRSPVELGWSATSSSTIRSTAARRWRRR